MPESFAEKKLRLRKLRHDFNNDIYSLKLNVETLKILRADHEKFDKLAQLMQETISTLQARVAALLDAVETGCPSDPGKGAS